MNDRPTPLQALILGELITPSWIADAIFRQGNEAWPFQVRSVQGALGRLEARGWVKRDWPARERRSRGWRISEQGRAAQRTL